MKKLVFTLTFVATAFFFLGTEADAQNITQGYRLMEIDGMLDPATAAGTEIELSGSYGIFIQDYLMVGGMAAISLDDDVKLFSLGPAVELLFPSGSSFVPFVGGTIAIFSANYDAADDDNALLFHVYGGVKYFLNESAAINLDANIYYATEEVYLNDDDGDWSNMDFDIRLGIGFYF